MSNVIDSIKLSGTVYTLSAQTSGGGNPTVELTQAEYDSLVTAGTVSADTYYIITDAQAGDLTNYYTKSETNTLLGGKADTATTYTKTETDNAITAATSTKQDTLVSSHNIKTINNESILGSGNIDIQGGGGKAIVGGRGIAITSGETADTVSFDLPIYSGTGEGSIIGGFSGNTASGKYSIALGGRYENMFDYQYCKATGKGAISFGGTASGQGAFSCGENPQALGMFSVAFGDSTKATGVESFVIGRNTSANTFVSFAQGRYTKTTNEAEVALGEYNNSVSSSSTFGNSGNTLFSVGNGTSNSARHNAFEIRQNGDIYLSLNGQDVKLQDQLGGGGSSYTAGDGIDITNDVISVTGKADTSAVTAIQDSLSGYVTTDTEQIISGRKIFTYTSGSNKAIEFKQNDDSAKVGFRVRTSAATNNELASFEFRPNTFTIDGVQHPLIYFGHYRNTNTANAGVPQTVIGFRQYDQKNAAAYHYVLPLPEKAKTPFNLTTSFKDYYAPMGFKNGSTMITADNTGVVDLSSELGGLKLVKLTQAEYDALATKDSNTLYVIVN